MTWKALNSRPTSSNEGFSLEQQRAWEALCSKDFEKALEKLVPICSFTYGN